MSQRILFGIVVAALLSGAGCGSGGSTTVRAATGAPVTPPVAQPPAPSPAPGSGSAIAFPTFDRVFGTATHNSYWINREPLVDWYASGTEELILDQLLHERVRALELDLHTDDARPGNWTVYHTDCPANAQVSSLADFLEVLRVFHHAVPEHEAIMVVLELKNTDPDWSNLPFTTHNFSATHTIADFDRTIRAALPGALLEPRDLLARAPAGLTLSQAVAAAGWPTTDALRGKFIFTVLGYWCNAAYDWARYGGEGDIAERACFPIRCVFDPAGNGVSGSWPGNLIEPVPPAWLAAAREASIFWQVENFAYPDVQAFLARGGIVRGMDSYTPADQEDRVRRGFHFLQTDYPWNMTTATPPAGSGIPWDPSSRNRDPAAITGGTPIDPEALIEPGLRLYASAPDPAPRFAYGTFAPGAGPRRWETIVSTTRIGDPKGRSYPRVAREGGTGGLMAAASRRDFVRVLRVKTGVSGDGWAQERLAVRVEVSRAGAVTAFDFPASAISTDVIGSMIALEVDDLAGGGSVVRAYSAGRLDGAGNPTWRLLREERFAAPLVYQGLAFTNDVLFVRTTAAGGAVDTCTISSLDGGPAVVADLSYPRAAATCAPLLAPLP